MERRLEITATEAHAAAITAVALIGPLFGIATQVWAQAVLLLGLATVLILAPPRRSPGTVWLALFGAIFTLGLTAFLPARWFAIPGWRSALAGEFRMELPGTLSPQPWVSAHSACLLFAGLAFALYLATHTWGAHERRQAARWYTGWIAVLAAVALIALARGWHVPIWPEVLNSQNGFGIFPNRNQTANVFALAGIMATALAFEGFRRREKGAWFWVVSAVVLGAAILPTRSRAGVLLFFGGIAAWALVAVVRSESRSRSRKGAGLVVAGLALMLTAFFVFGGGSFDRMQNLGRDSQRDFRIVIQKDALRLTAAAPWLGQGLGNFAPVFAMSRAVSADQNRAIHPESDWLWVAVEMGWPAAVLFAAAFALWLGMCLPLSSGTDRTLRAAAMVCGVMFALHSLGDVSGHRPGSAWPALFLAGLAVNPRRMIENRRWAAPLFRSLGVLLALISAWWLASIASEKVAGAAPTPANAQALMERARQRNLNSRHDGALADANAALRIAPLNADMYFQRAIARLGGAFSQWGAAWDFGTARFLEPHWTAICFEEGKAWLDSGRPDLALDAWIETLRRAGAKGPAMYGHMLQWAGYRHGMHSALAKLVRGGPEYLLTFLEHADKLETDLLTRQLIEAEPKLTSLTADQRKRLFKLWCRKGDRSLLLSTLHAHPDWQQDGWQCMAAIHAEAKDFHSACEIAREFTPRPAMPKIILKKPLQELERMFRIRHDDIEVGLQLYTVQVSLGKTNDAIETLRALQAVPNHPAYLDFIETELYEESESWEQAWNAWLRFGGRDFQ